MAVVSSSWLILGFSASMALSDVVEFVEADEHGS